MLIVLSLGILIVLTLLNMLLGAGFTSVDVLATIEDTLVVNGSSSSLDYSQSSYTFTIDPAEGVISVIIGMVVIASIFGINILSSGLNSESVRIITFGFVFAGIWGILSVLSWSLIIGIPTFGWIFWITLTIMYAVGVVKKMSMGG